MSEIMTGGPRFELRSLIVQKLAGRFGTEEEEEAAADALMQLFYTVTDRWTEVDITEMRADGYRTLDQRFLVCEVPRESRPRDRIADRTVASRASHDPPR